MIDRLALTAELMACRDRVKSIFGERWPAKVDEFRPLFAATMCENGCAEFQAIGHIQRASGVPLPEMLAAVLIAVAVELVEARS